MIRILFAVILFVNCRNAVASSEWTLKNQITIEDTPLSTVASQDGKSVYVLIQGKILIYSTVENKIVDFLPVDKSFDKLAYSAPDNLFILASSKDKQLKVFKLEHNETIDVSGLPFKGPENAPVTIAVFSDYQCPYCGKLDPLLQQVLSKYPHEVKLVEKNFPLPFHSFAKRAAIAVLAANDQGKFWEFHKKLFENISALNEAKMQAIATELKLDMERFRKKLNDPEIIRLIERDLAEGQRIGVNGTPSIFVNGKPLQGWSLQGFQDAINAELKR